MTLVVDASAVVAILRNEPERADFIRVLLQTDDARMSVVNAWEVMARHLPNRGPEARGDVDRLLGDLGIRLEEVSLEQLERAVDAQLRYGWSTPARLNMGECFAYALAASLDAPILFKGEDFARTDARSAL